MGNLAVRRCSQCNDNCAVCVSLVQCQECKKDTLHRKYIIQADGSCREVPNTFLDKYRWWAISLAIFAGMILCLGLVRILQCLCNWCCHSPRRYDFDSDS